ncbi:MAG: hypothetical protein ACK5HP_00610 [Bacilli bacterium]
MDQVPTMISSKDLDYLSDIFNWNFNAFKLINHFINEVTNEEMINLFESLKEMHLEICTDITEILE